VIIPVPGASSVERVVKNTMIVDLAEVFEKIDALLGSFAAQRSLCVK
jgi:hypothetical protein